MDELIDLEIQDLSAESDDTRYPRDVTDKVKDMLGKHMLDPATEQKMVDYLAQWTVADAGAKTPQDVVRLLARLDDFSARRTGRKAGVLYRLYQEALRSKAMTDQGIM